MTDYRNNWFRNMVEFLDHYINGEYKFDEEGEQ